ncbi:MAG: hypothetical protein COB78_01530 [Hyphomicrobiales bacterium]|nr:MAG: hypothetical protein COB78_01530 [Hyphomicrobiales bacterium]
MICGVKSIFQNVKQRRAVHAVNRSIHGDYIGLLRVEDKIGNSGAENQIYDVVVGGLNGLVENLCWAFLRILFRLGGFIPARRNFCVSDVHRFLAYINQLAQCRFGFSPFTVSIMV